MGRLLTLMTGILIGGILMYIGFNYHIVVTEKTYHFIPKQHVQLAGAYADVRSWGVEEWDRNPVLAQAVTAAGHGDLVKKSLQEQWLQELFRHATKPRQQ